MHLPGNYAILAPDSPKFTVVAVNDSYLIATESKREDVLYKGIFEAYPKDPSGVDTNGVDRVRASLEKVLRTKEKDNVGIVRYDIPVNCTRQYDTKYWSPTHIPILDDNGEVQYIIESALDITHLVQIGLKVPKF